MGMQNGRGLCLTAMAATLAVAAACATEPLAVLGPPVPVEFAAGTGSAAGRAGRREAGGGNRVTMLRDGAGTFPAMFAALAAAHDHINLEYYVFDDVHWHGQSLGDLLAAKLAAGVAVNVIYDGYGSMDTDPAFLDRLRQGGARLVVFGPLNPLTSGTLHNPNDRDHRKIMIVDGHIAFVGGVNLDRVYRTRASPATAATTLRRPTRSTPMPASTGRRWRRCSGYSCGPGSRQTGPSCRRAIGFPMCRRRAIRQCASSVVRRATTARSTTWPGFRRCTRRGSR